MRFHSTHSRDSSLRRLSRLNRWLIAASVALTALFAEAAAHAFPGKSTSGATSKDKHSSTRPGRRAGSAGGGSSDTTTRSLGPPAEAPQATSETPPPGESTPERAAPSEESAPPAEAAPAEEPAREPEPQSAQESAPVVESPPPVVSGGS